MNPIDRFGDAVSTNPWLSLVLLVVPGVIQWFVGGRPNGIAGLFAAILASFKPQPTPGPVPVDPVNPIVPAPTPSPMPLLTNLIEILRSLALLKVHATDAEKTKILEAETAIKETIGPLAIDCCAKPHEINRIPVA